MSLPQQVILMLLGAFVGGSGIMLLFTKTDFGQFELSFLDYKFKVGHAGFPVLVLGCALLILPFIAPWLLPHPNDPAIGKSEAAAPVSAQSTEACLGPRVGAAPGVFVDLAGDEPRDREISRLSNIICTKLASNGTKTSGQSTGVKATVTLSDARLSDIGIDAQGQFGRQMSIRVALRSPDTAAPAPPRTFTQEGHSRDEGEAVENALQAVASSVVQSIQRELLKR